MNESGKVTVGGDTFGLRDQLRSLGGTWDDSCKVWRVPGDRVRDVLAACDRKSVAVAIPTPDLVIGDAAEGSTRFLVWKPMGKAEWTVIRDVRPLDKMRHHPAYHVNVVGVKTFDRPETGSDLYSRIVSHIEAHQQ